MEDTKKLVVKHNKLVEFKGRMSLNELKLFSLIIADVREQQEMQFQEYKICVSILKQTTNHKDFYNYIKEVALKLEEKRIVVEGINNNKKRYFTTIRLINKPRYTEESNCLVVDIDRDLIPYIVDLKREFTRYQIENILRLKSSYSIRVYELLKQYESIEKREFKIDDLREYLGIKDGEYSRFYDFEKWTLKVAKKEINEFTDLNIDYKKNKKGKSISSITFAIRSKDVEDKVYIDYLNQSYNIEDMKKKMEIDKENFNTKQVMAIYEIAVLKTQDLDLDIFKYVHLNYLHMMQKGTVRNKYSYLMKALENDYAKAAAQLSIFNSFDEVAVTYE